MLFNKFLETYCLFLPYTHFFLRNFTFTKTFTTFSCLLLKTNQYEKITLGALTLLLITTACRDDSYTLSTESTPNLVTPALHTRVSDSQSPLTGIVEAYPCLQGSSIYFGNYVNNTLSVFYGFTMFRMETL